MKMKVATPTKNAASKSKAAIELARRQVVRAFSSGNAGTCEEWLAEDAVWILPGEPAVEGRPAIRSRLERMFGEFRCSMAFGRPRVEVTGDWAVERGEYRTRLTSRKMGDKDTVGGAYLLLWRRSEASGWQVERFVDEARQ